MSFKNENCMILKIFVNFSIVKFFSDESNILKIDKATS